MAPWWAWVLLWVLLLAGSAVWLGLLSRRVWRKVTVLSREVERAAAAVAAGSSRPGPRSCVTCGPASDSGHPASSQDVGAVSGATGLGTGRSSSAPR